MEYRISATELARRLGDILGRIRYRSESFIVERNGRPVARIGPVGDSGSMAVRKAAAGRIATDIRDHSLAEHLGQTIEAGGARDAGEDPAIGEIRRKVAEVMRRRGVVRAGVFGSVARGETALASDVDFLVEFEPGRTLLDLSGLRLDLAGVLGRDVDVATANSLHPGLKDEIMGDLVPIL